MKSIILFLIGISISAMEMPPAPVPVRKNKSVNPVDRVKGDIKQERHPRDPIANIINTHRR